MKSRASCIRIEEGSAINIQQENLQLGRNSIGMLALYDDARINIEFKFVDSRKIYIEPKRK